jgi:hypothetical protein
MAATQRRRHARRKKFRERTAAYAKREKKVEGIACQRKGASLVFATPPLATSSNGNIESKNSSLAVLTDRKNDVR